MRRFRLGIVGIGGMGSAAAWWASTRLGDDVIGFERFELGHRRGASEDHSRIIRLSYHRPDAVRLAEAAYRAWSAVETVSAVRLVVCTGGLDLYPAGSSIDAAGYLDAMDACGVGYEVLDAADAMRRWPMFRLDPDTTVVHQADGGLVRAVAANAAHRRLAVGNGTTLLDRTPVRRIEPAPTGFVITAGEERVPVDRLIITADAWTNQVTAGLGCSINLTVTQEQVAYFPIRSGSGTERMPVWIWMDDPSFYGLPSVDGSGAKIGQDVGGAVVTGDDRSFDPDPGYRERLIGFQERLIPGSTGPIVEERTCLYTMTPDREFVLDHLPGHEGAVIGLGAAHGFKFASVFGRILSDLAIDGATEHDIAGWSATRPILTQTGAATSFLL
ncbi:N-methyl-L-tryptophan oxidase [soil metagenome]